MSFQSKEVIGYYNILNKNEYEVYKEIIRKHLDIPIKVPKVPRPSDLNDYKKL